MHARTGDLAFGLDTAVVVAASVLICTSAGDLERMRVAMPLLLGARLVAWALLPRRERDTGALVEAGLFCGGAALGGLNDWVSVDLFRVYSYRVPTDLAGISRIPSWMLLFWGMILRYPLTLAHWRRLALPPHGSAVFLGRRAVGGVPARLVVLLVVIATTRQCVYRLYGDSLWSWLPMGVGLALVLALLQPDARRLRLAAFVFVVGPAVEALYIRVAGLHVYELGWLAGVPLWIALWWVIAVLAWEEVASRVVGERAA